MRHFLKEEKGSILIETAIALPVLVMAFLMAFETARYILIQQKVARVSASVNDMMARVSDPEAQFSNIVGATQHIMAPFDAGNESVIVIASIITHPEGQATQMIWQETGGGALNETSQIGQTGAAPILPTDFALNENEVVLVTEVIFNYTPFVINGLISGQTLYKAAFNKPRLQNLSLLEN